MKRITLGIAAVVAVFAISAFAPVHAALPDARVIDGDTINMPMSYVTGMPTRISVRLLGVNTPETRGACQKEIDAAAAAKLFVRDALAKATTVVVTYSRWDKYGGRIDGRITLDGKDLSQMLIDGGYGVAYSGGVRVNVWCP